jgi:hypothetical protein
MLFSGISSQAFTADIAAVIVCGVVIQHRIISLFHDAEVTERMNWVYTGRL